MNIYSKWSSWATKGDKGRLNNMTKFDSASARRSVFGTVAVLLVLAGSNSVADEESGHHDLPHNHIALFAGVGFENDGNDHEARGAAIGLEYELQYHEKWGIGFELEKLYDNDDEAKRSWVAAFPVSYHPNEQWRFFSGPGVESGDHQKFLMRFGVAYEIPFAQNWTASPAFLMDFIEGGAVTAVLGVAVGFGF
jgi:hypothetical protein